MRNSKPIVTLEIQMFKGKLFYCNIINIKFKCHKFYVKPPPDLSPQLVKRNRKKNSFPRFFRTGAVFGHKCVAVRVTARKWHPRRHFRIMVVSHPGGGVDPRRKSSAAAAAVFDLMTLRSPTSTGVRGVINASYPLRKLT